MCIHYNDPPPRRCEVLTLLSLVVYSLIFVYSKISPATYDEILCKFLFCTYENSRNLIWSKKIIKGTCSRYLRSLSGKWQF